MTQIRKSILLLSFFCLPFVLNAFEGENTLGFDFTIGQNAQDFDLGAGFTTPHFAKSMVAFRVACDAGFRAVTWKPYLLTNIVVTAGDFIKSANIRLYGGGGVVLAFPFVKDAKTVAVGGQGFFGFEFFFAEKRGAVYFVELGGNGIKNTGGISINGFMIKTGLRYYVAL